MRLHTLLWLLAMILIFVLSPLLSSPDRYIAAIDHEVQQSSQWYAYSELDRITANGESLYHLLMVSTGVDPAIKKYMIRTPPSKEMAPGAKLPDHISKWADQFLDYWASLLCNMHLFCFRLAHSAVWFGYLLPFLAAIIFDGVMTRQAKIESFKYTSPTIYNISWHLMIAIICCSIVYFALSVPISVFFYPSMITVFGVLARALICNIQHSA